MAANLWTCFIADPIRVTGDVLRWLGREGAWKLRFPTGEIIKHLASKIPDDESRILIDQLNQPFFQCWCNQGRVNPIFFLYDRYSVTPYSRI